MTPDLDEEHVARARLTYLAEPGDPVLASWLEVSPPAEIIAAISAGQLPVLPGIRTWTPTAACGARATCRPRSWSTPSGSGGSGWTTCPTGWSWPGSSGRGSGWSAPATASGPPS